MKKAIILSIMLCAVIASGIAEHYFVHKTFDTFNEKLEALEKVIDDNDTESALSQVIDLQSWWREKKKTIDAISYCPDARQVNVVIGEIQGSIEAEDMKNASSKIISLYELIDNIKGMLDFNARDII